MANNNVTMAYAYITYSFVMYLCSMFVLLFWYVVNFIILADPEGGLRGLQPPPLNFQKKDRSPAWPS